MSISGVNTMRVIYDYCQSNHALYGYCFFMVVPLLSAMVAIYFGYMLVRSIRNHIQHKSPDIVKNMAIGTSIFILAIGVCVLFTYILMPTIIEESKILTSIENEQYETISGTLSIKDVVKIEYRGEFLYYIAFNIDGKYYYPNNLFTQGEYNIIMSSPIDVCVDYIDSDIQSIYVNENEGELIFKWDTSSTFLRIRTND